MANYQSIYTGEQIDEGIGKANKALVIPDTVPDSPRIVSIATDGTQQDLTLGNGLSVADGVISASGGGGGSVSSLVKGFVRINYYLGSTYKGCKYVPIGSSDYLDQILERAGALYQATTYAVWQYHVFHFGAKYYYYKIEGVSHTGAMTASYEEIHSIQVNDADYQSHSFTDGEVIKIVLTAPSSGGGGSN